MAKHRLVRVINARVVSNIFAYQGACLPSLFVADYITWKISWNEALDYRDRRREYNGYFLGVIERNDFPGTLIRHKRT
uniref:Uncharacterized protein n=1 Tax=Candidatus Kentrum eta TaxID=2126337 RepID=A0A450VDM9_9GAMM|nr:MAG: hypothetical protein BECKH772B_GA0070898_103114 [Candidatus Kentron sp. H]VFK03164.1 MAG: hypothetical protein BECKH772A_GA0070896_103094 [Candidatus Kentron sp. H]VFK06699.1 MAG: hypothetical protein BECKH772C_GA0070978_103692 [Candidatus Kentron sp. H]